MAYDVSQLLKKSQVELDALFRDSPPGPIPSGPAEGTAIIAPGTAFSAEIAKVINIFGWQGKTFDAMHGTLRNRITVFHIDAIVAEVYEGKSLLDGKPCIVLDYSKTSLIAERVRDEIRQIADDTYLGRVFWDDRPTIFFALQFG
jgi:hypothetical protein